MQQRRPRLGDILDDYCPRERRITNHAVVAMIEDEVKQVRCSTCDADHDYRQAKVPLSRKRKRDDVPLPESAEAAVEELPVDAEAPPSDVDDQASPEAPAFDDAPETVFADGATDEPEPIEDEGPVHRRLIRATLPRPEGQTPERKAPDFTMRQPGGRFDQNRGGQRQRGRQGRQPQKASGGQPGRFGGPRQGGGGSGNSQGERHGNRFGNPSGQRGGRPQGSGRGQRQDGQGRKRGR